jgi:hypothetical protein
MEQRKYRHEHVRKVIREDVSLAELVKAQKERYKYCRYKIVRTDTGINISYHESFTQAKTAIVSYNQIDKIDGVYTPRRYIIRPVTLRFLKKQQAWAEHAKTVNP